VDSVNLAGLDRVLVAYAAGSSERSLLLRQYRIGFKKSGTKVSSRRICQAPWTKVQVSLCLSVLPSSRELQTSMQCILSAAGPLQQPWLQD
jgi:hypothetical protein